MTIHDNFPGYGTYAVGDIVYDRRRPGRSGKLEDVFQSFSDKMSHVIVLWEDGQREETTTATIYKEEPSFWREEGALDPKQESHVVDYDERRDLVSLGGRLRSDIRIAAIAKVADDYAIEDDVAEEMVNSITPMVDTCGRIHICFADGTTYLITIQPDGAIIIEREVAEEPVGLPYPVPEVPVPPGFQPPSAYPPDDSDVGFIAEEPAVVAGRTPGGGFRVGDRVALVRSPSYRGTIIGHEGNRWTIEFDDGRLWDLPSESLIKVSTRSIKRVRYS